MIQIQDSLRSGIHVSPCILVIAALSLIHCQTFGGNDDEQEDCGGSAA